MSLVTQHQRVSCLLAGCCDSINRIFHRLDPTFLGKQEKAHLWCRKIPFGYLKVSQKSDKKCRFIECIFSRQARAFMFHNLYNHDCLIKSAFLAIKLDYFSPINYCFIYVEPIVFMGNASLLPLRIRIIQSRAPFHSFTVIINVLDVDKISVMNEDSGGSMLLFLPIKTFQILKPIFISELSLILFTKRARVLSRIYAVRIFVTH